eukprot:767376-Hanusia_phi.AAC.2
MTQVMMPMQLSGSILPSPVQFQQFQSQCISGMMMTEVQRGFALNPSIDMLLDSVFQDLETRFIINCPSEDDSNQELMLLMFEVEKAHWYYVDFWRKQHPHLPAYSLREFGGHLFRHSLLLQAFSSNYDTIYAEWLVYKRAVPTFGACILNQDCTKILLVRGYNSKTWGWPKGKVNKSEQDAICAAREVMEEIGFDILPFINEKDTIHASMREHHMKLYVISGISESTIFETRTRQEISEIAWHPLNEIGQERDSNKCKYYSVAPVLAQLKSWIAQHKRSLSRSKTPVRFGKDDAKAGQNRRSTTPSKSDTKVKKATRGACDGHEIDAAGVARDNAATFGTCSGGTRGFSAEEMFRVNEENFGIISTYSFEQYTTALPGQKTNTLENSRPKYYAERFRQCDVCDGVQSFKPEGAAGCSFLTFKFDVDDIMGAFNL